MIRSAAPARADSSANPPKEPVVNQDPLRFDAAINPYGCAPSVLAAIREAVTAPNLRGYGDADAGALRRALGRHFDLPPDHFVAYNGSGEGFVWLCLTRLMFARRALVCPFPSYERFVEVARRCATNLVEVPLDPDTWALPIPALIDAARASDAGAVMISSPNNPTANHLLDDERLVELLRALPDTLVMVDEAYADYAGRSFAPLVTRFANLAVLKTFSKAYGLAGLRVGYVVAHPRTAAALRTVQIPWSVDTLALTGAEAALGDQAYLTAVSGRIRAETAAFGTALAACPGLEVAPSDANFFLVAVRDPDRRARLEAGLAARRLVVRRRPDLPDHFRVTCMSAEMNRVLLETIDEAGD
jgi:histidinol-phosphate aminotransferase